MTFSSRLCLTSLPLTDCISLLLELPLLDSEEHGCAEDEPDSEPLFTGYCEIFDLKVLGFFKKIVQRNTLHWLTGKLFTSFDMPCPI